MDHERSLIAQKFRSLADQFKTFATKELSGLAVPHLDTQAEAGKLIVRVYKQGYLPDLPGLAEMIHWTKEPDQDGYRLTSDNLFRVFCGTHHALTVDPRHGAKSSATPRLTAAYCHPPFPMCSRGRR